MQKLWLRADGCSGTLAIPLTTGKERKKLRLIAPPPPPPRQASQRHTMKKRCARGSSTATCH